MEKKNKRGWTPLVFADDSSETRVWNEYQNLFHEKICFHEFRFVFLFFILAFQVVASHVGVPHDGFVIVKVVSQQRWHRSLSWRWLPWWSRFGVRGFTFCHGRCSRGGWFSGEAGTSMVVRLVVYDTVLGGEGGGGGELGWVVVVEVQGDVESFVVMVEAKIFKMQNISLLTWKMANLIS